jgi:hypothetical protein
MAVLGFQAFHPRSGGPMSGALPSIIILAACALMSAFYLKA